MSGILQAIQDLFIGLYDTYGDGLLLLAGFIAFVGVVAQWKLYAKAGQPGVASIVPIFQLQTACSSRSCLDYESSNHIPD